MKYFTILVLVLGAGWIVLGGQDPPKRRIGFSSDLKLTVKNLSIASTGDCLKVQSDKSLAPEACGGSGTTIPSGLITFIAAGTCPTGWSEVSALNGKFLRGTLAANDDVGNTGGSDTITDVLNHTHAVNVTDPGHAHTLQRYPTATGTSSGYTADTSMSGTPAAVTLPMESQTTGITAATANPAGGVASIDNRPAFVNVIFCAKD